MMQGAAEAAALKVHLLFLATVDDLLDDRVMTFFDQGKLNKLSFELIKESEDFVLTGLGVNISQLEVVNP